MFFPLENTEFYNSTNYFLKFGYLKEKKAIKLDSNLIYYVDYSQIKSLGVSNQLSYYPISIGLGALKSRRF